MLTPEYLEQFSSYYLGMVDVVNEQIVRDVARRIAKTGRITETADWQIRQAKEAGMLTDDIIRDIAALTNISDSEVRRMFQEAGLEGMRHDASALIDAGMMSASEVKLSGAMQNVLKASAEKCINDMNNLTLTTAIATQERYMQALNEAYMKVVSGGFSYSEALRAAIKRSAMGGAYVEYASGYQSKLDVAMRRSLLTGVNQTAGKLTEMYSKDLGAEYYETTAHPGARPTHAVWQGKVFKIEGHDRYPNFYESTGYGTGAGLCGWNCRHSFYPYWPGISKPAYTDGMLKEYSRAKYKYNGKMLTEYECGDIQRAFEREIRAHKRVLTAYNSFIENAADREMKARIKEEFSKEAVKLKEEERKMKEFCKETNRRVDNVRTQVHGIPDGHGNVIGFDRSVSSKAVWANRNRRNL